MIIAQIIFLQNKQKKKNFFKSILTRVKMSFFDELLLDFVCEEVIGEYLWPYGEMLHLLELKYKNSSTIDFCKKVSMDVKEIWMWEDYTRSIMDRKNLFYPCTICMKEPLKRKLPRKNDKICKNPVCKKITEERNQKFYHFEENFDLRLVEFALKEECYECLNYLKKIDGSSIFIKRIGILSQTAANHWNVRPLKWLQKVVPNPAIWPMNLHIFAIINGNMDVLKEIQKFLGPSIFWHAEPFSVLIETNNIDMADYIYDQMTQYIFSLYIACIVQNVKDFDLDEPSVTHQQPSRQFSYFRSFPIILDSSQFFEGESIITDDEEQYPLTSFTQERNYNNHQRVINDKQIDSINDFLITRSKNRQQETENPSVDDLEEHSKHLDDLEENPKSFDGRSERLQISSKRIQSSSRTSSSQDMNQLVKEYYTPDTKWIPECDWRPVLVFQNGKKMKNIFEEKECNKNLCWKGVPLEERSKAVKFLKQMLHLNYNLYQYALNLNRPAFFYWLTQQFIPFPMNSFDYESLLNKDMDQFLNPSNPSLYDSQFIKEFTLNFEMDPSLDDNQKSNLSLDKKPKSSFNLFHCFSSFLVQQISMPHDFIVLLWNRGDFELLKELSLYQNSDSFWNKQLFIEVSFRNEKNLFAFLYELDQYRSQKLSVPITKISIRCFLWAVENLNYDLIRFLVKIAPQHIQNPKICNKAALQGSFLSFLRNEFNPPFVWTENTSLQVCYTKNLAMLSWMTSTKDPCPINYEACIRTIGIQNQDHQTKKVLLWLLQKAPKSCVASLRPFLSRNTQIDLESVLESSLIIGNNYHINDKPKKSSFSENCIIS